MVFTDKGRVKDRKGFSMGKWVYSRFKWVFELLRTALGWQLIKVKCPPKKKQVKRVFLVNY